MASRRTCPAGWGRAAPRNTHNSKGLRPVWPYGEFRSFRRSRMCEWERCSHHCRVDQLCNHCCALPPARNCPSGPFTPPSEISREDGRRAGRRREEAPRRSALQLRTPRRLRMAENVESLVRRPAMGRGRRHAPDILRRIGRRPSSLQIQNGQIETAGAFSLPGLAGVSVAGHIGLATAFGDVPISANHGPARGANCHGKDDPGTEA
jgi:hypothetical protein